MDRCPSAQHTQETLNPSEVWSRSRRRNEDRPDQTLERTLWCYRNMLPEQRQRALAALHEWKVPLEVVQTVQDKISELENMINAVTPSEFEQDDRVWKQLAHEIHEIMETHKP